MSIGIYGGTFNPIHSGHIHVANSLIQNSDCESILFVPAAAPPHKKMDSIQSFKKRFSWVKQCTDSNPAFSCSNIEQEKNISYSIDLLKALKKEYPKDELRLIMGNDMSSIFSTWKGWSEILTLARPLVLVRESFSLTIDKKLDLKTQNLFKQSIVHLNTLNISSTQIRESVSKEETIKGLVPTCIEGDVIEAYRA